MATPLVTGSTSNTTTSATTITIAYPSAVANGAGAGQLLLLWGNWDTAASTTLNHSITAPNQTTNPWRSLQDKPWELATGSPMWWRIADGTEGTQETITWSGANRAGVIMVSVSGASKSPVEVSVGHLTTFSGTSNIVPAVVPKLANDLLLGFWYSQVATIITEPASMTWFKREVNSGLSIMAASENLVAAGTTGTRTATGGSGWWAGTLILVREPSAVGLALADHINITDNPNADRYGAGAGTVSLAGCTSGFWGLYKVAGYAKDIASLDPLSRRVVLFDPLGHKAIRGAMSLGADGYFCFDRLAPGRYLVLGVDQNNVQNGVVAAYIDAVEM